MFTQYDSNSTNMLDLAIKDNDLDYAKNLLKEKPELKNYINQKLYSLIGSDNPVNSPPPLTGKTFLLITRLLSIGADPNYIKDTGFFIIYTLLDEAVMKKSPRLVKVLLEYGAHPLGRASDTTLEQLSSADNKNFLDYCQRNLPIQRAYTQHMNNCFDENKEIFNLLSDAFWKIYGKELETQFKNVFKQIVDEVSTAHMEAKKVNKRLMILIGEGHTDFNGFLIELMTYLVASKLFGINTVLTEEDQKLVDYFNKTGRRLTQKDKWQVPLSFENILKENKVTIVPIDIEHTTLIEQGVDIRSEEGMMQRNTTMVSCANQVNADVLCVVGGAHLYGMLNETDLESNFYVLPISTLADYEQIQKLKTNPMLINEFEKKSYETRAEEYPLFFPEKVKNFTALQHRGYQTFISPDIANKIILKLFDELKPKETHKPTV